MNEQEKLEALAEVFDCDAGELTAKTSLSDLQWDSMAVLSVIALLKARFGRKVAGSELRAFETVGDIMAVMEK